MARKNEFKWNRTNQMVPNRPKWFQMVPNSPFQMAPNCPIWAYLETFSFIWSHMGLFGAIWNHLGLLGTILLVLFEPFKFIFSSF